MPSTPATPASGDASSQPRAPDGTFTSITDYRYTAADNVAPWAVGRTPTEVAQMADQLYREQVSRVQQQPQYQPPVQPVNGLRPPTQDDYLTDPVGATNRQIQYVAQTQFQPQLDASNSALATTSRQLAEFKYAEEFKKYGPEILQLEQNVPATQRNGQTYDFIVDIVRGRHAKEIQNGVIEQEIQRRMQTQGAIRPDGSGGAAGAPSADPTRLDLDSRDLPGWWTDWCREKRVTAATIDEFLTRSKLYGTNLADARKKYVEAVKKQDTKSPIMEYDVAGRTV